jgi:hypothetical protein
MINTSQEEKVSDATGGAESRNGKGTTMKTERFMVGYTVDYGYSLFLRNKDGEESIIVPEFTSEQVIKLFEAFFSTENNKSRIGRTSFCDCRGEYYESNDVKKFRIYEAHLFAE